MIIKLFKISYLSYDLLKNNLNFIKKIKIQNYNFLKEGPEFSAFDSIFNQLD